MASASQLRKKGIVLQDTGSGDKSVRFRGAIIGYAYIDNSGHWVFDPSTERLARKIFDSYRQFTNALVSMCKNL